MKAILEEALEGQPKAGYFAVRATQDLVFDGCQFVGDPPAPFVTWLDWASQPTLQGVRIQALEALGPPIPLDLTRTSPKVTDHG